jgi:endo-1,4-beta-xylanase
MENRKLGRSRYRRELLAGACLLLGACTSSDAAHPSSDAAHSAQNGAAAQAVRLKDVFADAFLIGAALNADEIHGRDARDAELVRTHFNTITAENVLKWAQVHPALGRYDFAQVDRYVEFGVANGMFIVGHTLIWHTQTPSWVYTDRAGRPVSRDTLLGRMRDHIRTVVGRYRGRIRGWDVVNEALNDDGTLRVTPWLEIIGEDYLVKAFEFAREADPRAELYYNDYMLENPQKRRGAIALIERLRAAGVAVHGVGLQGHNRMDWPTAAQHEETIAALARLGVQVMITELDVDVLPRIGRLRGIDINNNALLQNRLNAYRDSLPQRAQQALARRYAELFGIYLDHKDAISRVTFWGVSDADSWLNDYPIRGRTNYPLLFDRAGRPKAAFDAVVRVARQQRAGGR